MRLLLSSDALPFATPGELAAACRRRALSGLELTLLRAHGHGLDDLVSTATVPATRRIQSDAETPVEWLYLSDSSDSAEVRRWAAMAEEAGAGLLLARPIEEVPANCRVALIHGTDRDEACRAADWASRHGAHTCWQVGPEGRDRDLVADVLRITIPHLAHVRLLGAGPEVGGNPDTPSGTGLLMGKLALSGYTGSIALAPYAAERLQEWEDWLLVRRGWGCGTAAEKQDRKNGIRVEISLSI